jgi:hypothetical protein
MLFSDYRVFAVQALNLCLEVATSRPIVRGVAFLEKSLASKSPNLIHHSVGHKEFQFLPRSHQKR